MEWQPRDCFSEHLNIVANRDLMRLVAALGLLALSEGCFALTEETRYSVFHQTEHPDFWTAIERKGPCAVPGKPAEPAVIPWQKYYPVESRKRNETGKVVVSIIFDADSCPLSAMLVRSSGFWRLDAATLRLAILTKTTARSETDDGQPHWLIAINWELRP